jgi:hypothetical protein
LIQAREVAQAELAIARQKVDLEIVAAKAKEDSANPPEGNGGKPSQVGAGMVSADTEDPPAAREAPNRRKGCPRWFRLGIGQ